MLIGHCYNYYAFRVTLTLPVALYKATSHFDPKISSTHNEHGDGR